MALKDKVPKKGLAGAEDLTLPGGRDFLGQMTHECFSIHFICCIITFYIDKGNIQLCKYVHDRIDARLQ